jgi:mannose/fructose/N-acetylgalactosamine-specific phosphotransferase system component IIC
LLQIHGYASLIVCLFGSVANSLNIAVLTRREMTSPTNALLTGLAVADLLVMLEYIPFACHMYILQDTRTDIERYSYSWATFVLFHSNFAQVILLRILNCLLCYSQQNDEENSES